MKLHKLPMPSKIRVVTDSGIKNAVVDHLDGMYSYCYLEEDHTKIFHLSRSTPMCQINGRWEIVALRPEDEIEDLTHKKGAYR